MTKVKFSLPRTLPLSRRSSLAISRSGWLSQQRAAMYKLPASKKIGVGFFGGRRSLARLLLDEIGDRLDERIDLLVQVAVNLQRRLEPHGADRDVVVRGAFDERRNRLRVDVVRQQRRRNQQHEPLDRPRS